MSYTRSKKAPYPVGPDGKPLCRCGCGQKPTGRRTSWFSQACVERYLIANDPGWVRNRLEEIHKGICANCKVDTARIQRKARRRHSPNVGHERFWRGSVVDRARYCRALAIFNRWQVRLEQARQNYRTRLAAQGWTLRRLDYGSAWDVDHVVAVVEGGGQPTSLDDYQPLCHPCHKRKTAELAARRARQKREARSPESTPVPPAA